MAINEKQVGDCGYIATYKGKRAELYAPSLYKAQQLAAVHFKVPAKKDYLVSVGLAEHADGSDVIHTATF